jgi:hypothetical protein
MIFFEFYYQLVNKNNKKGVSSIRLFNKSIHSLDQNINNGNSLGLISMLWNVNIRIDAKSLEDIVLC